MLKKRVAFLISALLILHCAFPCFAAGSTSAALSVVSAYYSRDHVYCCVQPGDPKADISSISVGVTSNDGSLSEMRAPKAVGGGDRAVTYMLLVDASVSMAGCQTRLNAFADALLRAERQEVQITIASFGKDFAVVEEGLNGSDQVRQAVDQISYTQQVSDISGGVTDALAYLSEHTEAGGVISNLIVLTDGEIYLSDTGRSAAQKAADKARQAIERASETIVHTVGLGTWDAATLRALSSGTGLDLSAGDRSSAAAAGRSIAGFVDGLYYMDLPFQAGQDTEFIDARLMLSFPSSDDLELIPIKSLRNLDYISLSSPDAPPEGSDAPEVPGPEGGADAPVPEDGPDEDGGGSADIDGEGGVSETPDVPEEGPHGDRGSGSAPGEVPDEMDAPKAPPWPLIAAGAAVALAAVIGVSTRRGRKKGRALGSARNGIRIRLEILSDSAALTRTDHWLTDELIIGSDRSCDIAIEDETVAGRNSRIYLRDDTIYIEDLNDVSNTCIGGMRIHAPNRLRNGDEVMAGRVRFRIGF